MPYTLTIENQSGFVHLNYNGTVYINERKAARQEVFDACNAHNLSRTLVDMSQSDIQISQTDAINFAATFKGPQLPANYRLACITAPGNQSDALIKIIIAQDGIDVRYFTDKDTALRWLLAN